jgi:hypothetical protein
MTNAFAFPEPFRPAAENAPFALSLSERMAFKTPSFGVCALGGGVASPLPVLRSKQTARRSARYRQYQVQWIFHLLLFAELSAGKKVIDVPNQDICSWKFMNSISSLTVC